MSFGKVARRSIRECVFVLAPVVAGYGATTISSQEFGASALGTPVTISVAVTGVTAGPATEGLSFGSDFSLGTCTPSGSGCALAVTFNPTKAGDRQDAVIVKDGQGNVVQEILLHGVGEGAHATFTPGTATLKAEPPLPSGYVWYFEALVAEPNGKLLVVVASAPAQYAPLNSAIYELDPASNSWTPIFVPSVVAGNSFGISGLAVDGSGSIYYNGGYIGQVAIHRIDRATGVDSVWVPVPGSAGGNTQLILTSLYVDAQGTLYVGENYQVFACDPNTRAVTLVAGNGTAGFSGDGGPAVNAELNLPSSLAKDRAGNLYIGDVGNYRVRKIDTSGTITTFAGNGSQSSSGDGVPAIDAGLGADNLALDAAGDLCLTDQTGLRCVGVNSGIIQTVVAWGGGTGPDPFTSVGVSSSARNFTFGGELAFDGDGNLWVIGLVSTNVNATGVGIFELTNTVWPISIGTAAYGQSRTVAVTVTDTGSAPAGPFSAVVTGANASNFSESDTCNVALAPGYSCKFNVSFTGVLPSVSTATLVLSNSAGQVLQSIALDGESGGVFPAVQAVASVTVGSTSASPAAISVQFTGSAVGTTAELAYGTEFQLNGVQCAGQGTVSCTAQVAFAPKYPGVRQDAIRFLDASGSPVYECFLSGTGEGPQYFYNPGALAQNTGPAGQAMDGAGNIYWYANGLIQEFNMQTQQTSVVAGQQGVTVDAGDGGPATQAQLGPVSALAFDPAGNMFIVEPLAVRRVDGKTGLIFTVAQSGGDSVAINGDGYVYIGSSKGNIVKQLDPTTGNFTTIAGNGQFDSSGDGGPATAASVAVPAALAFDANGDLYILEGLDGPVTENIRRVDRTTGIISTYARVKSGCGSVAIAFDPAGNLYYSGCFFFEMLSPGASSTYILNTGTPAVGFIDGSFLRHPSGTFYFLSGPVLSPAPPAPIQLPTAVVGGTPSTTTVELWNAGNANMAFSQFIGFTTISTPTATGVGGFGGSTTCGTSLAAGATCNITPVFVPGEVGQFTGLVFIDSNAGNQKPVLSGTGASSAIFLKTSSWDYGSVPIGANSLYAVGDFFVQNIATVPITINATISGPNAGDFQIWPVGSPPPPLQLVSYDTGEVLVSFLPTSPGAKTASLTLSAPGVQPVVIPLSGMAFQMGLQKAIGGSWKIGRTMPTAKDLPAVGGGLVLSDGAAEATPDGSEVQRAKAREATESAPMVAAPVVDPSAKVKLDSAAPEERTIAAANPPAEVQAATPNEKTGKPTSKSAAKKKGQKAKRRKLAKH